MRVRLMAMAVAAIMIGCGEKKAETPEKSTAPDTVGGKSVEAPPLPHPPPPAPTAGTDSIGIRGTELARIDSSVAGWQGYVYRNYAVAVREDTAGGVGEEIRVALRHPDEDQHAVVQRAIRAPDFVVPNDDANYYFGLAAGRIFIDQGTGPEPRGLAAYDIPSKKKIYGGTYSFPINMLDSNRLEFFKEIDNAPPGVPCPEKGEWTAGGLGIAYESKVVVDLSSGAESPTTEVRCAPRQ